MKFENAILHSLFAACLLICVLTIGAMITASPSASNAVAGQSNTAPSATIES